MSSRLDNRVAFISGGATGLGRRYAEYLSLMGAKVIINDIAKNTDGEYEAALTAEQINSHNIVSVSDYADITDREAVEQSLESYIKRFGKIDIFIHNAGVYNAKPLEESTYGEWDKVIGVHLTGAYNILKILLPVMKARNYGRIILVSSSIGMFGAPYNIGYAAAKMGIWGMAKGIDAEYSKYGIYCNVISPIAGSGKSSPDFIKKMSADFDVSHILPFVAFLSSDLCQDGGRVYTCGGGYHANIELYESEGILLKNDSIQKKCIVGNQSSIDVIHSVLHEIQNMDNPSGIFNFKQAAKKLFKKIKEV